MSIDIYSTYKINVETEYCYMDGEKLIKGQDYTEEIVSGSMLLEIIRMKLEGEYLNEFQFKGNTLFFKNYNHFNGDVINVEMNIKKVKRRDESYE